MLEINREFLSDHIKDYEYLQSLPYASLALQQLLNGTGAGSDFHGWVYLPDSVDKQEMINIKHQAKVIRTCYDAFVCVGIGGSYLGHKAIIEALSSLTTDAQKPEILYAAWNLSSRYLAELLQQLEKKDYCINVIAKEGIALETAVTFRILRHELERRFGKEGARERIIVTTDKYSGPLKDIATIENYPLFHLPKEVGGRFSVLTPVGLLPLAVAGLDIDAFMDGAGTMMHRCHENDFDNNPALQYAITRDILRKKGKQIELFVNYEPAMLYFSEWLKQLFGESEGKDGKGIFPASVLYSTDLHSLGQWVQEGPRHLFETVLTINTPQTDIPVPSSNDNLDRLKFLEGSSLNDIQNSIRQASMVAHANGGVPVVKLVINKIDEYNFGEIMYFFMMSVAISGYLSGINPFDQNGVEQYKAEMMSILAK